MGAVQAGLTIITWRAGNMVVIDVIGSRETDKVTIRARERERETNK